MKPSFVYASVAPSHESQLQVSARVRFTRKSCTVRMVVVRVRQQPICWDTFRAGAASIYCGRECRQTLVVADYGQLELRLLAHMANCESMLRAFELGGDFHSRTALGMYDHIKAAVAGGALHGPAAVALACLGHEGRSCCSCCQ